MHREQRRYSALREASTEVDQSGVNSASSVTCRGVCLLPAFSKKNVCLPAAETLTWKLPDDPVNAESSTASLGSVSVNPESASLPPLPLARHLPDSVPDRLGVLKETLSTEPAAISNSLLIRVGAVCFCDSCGALVDSSRVESFTAMPTD